MPGADKADRPDGIGFEMRAQTLVEREERRLHGFHEEAVMKLGGGENPGELALIEG